MGKIYKEEQIRKAIFNRVYQTGELWFPYISRFDKLKEKDEQEAIEYNKKTANEFVDEIIVILKGNK